MKKYFKSRLMYFQEPEGVKIKPESEMSSDATLTECMSGLFHTSCRGYSHPQLIF